DGELHDIEVEVAYQLRELRHVDNLQGRREARRVQPLREVLGAGSSQCLAQHLESERFAVLREFAIRARGVTGLRQNLPRALDGVLWHELPKRSVIAPHPVNKEATSGYASAAVVRGFVVLVRIERGHDRLTHWLFGGNAAGRELHEQRRRDSVALLTVRQR